MGNRLDSGWAYNEVDQLNAGSGYVYDMKGALEYDPGAAGDPRLHFQYGSDDLLWRIDREGSSPQDQSSMVWDADEQRLQLTEEVDYAEWQFLYDSAAGIPAVLFVKHIEDKQDDYLTYYVREPGGELLASFESGGPARYYHFDALGSTVLLSDSSGNPAGAYAYGAWGDVLASPGAWQPYQYVGQLGYYTHTTAQGSELADWLQLGVRFYQPELGRFERRDPEYGVPSLFLYSYCGDQPTVGDDPGGDIWFGDGFPWIHRGNPPKPQPNPAPEPVPPPSGGPPSPGLAPTCNPCDPKTFDCLACQEQFTDRCLIRCTAKYPSQPTKINDCNSLCHRRVDACGNNYCAVKTEKEKFLKCAEKALP